MTTITLTSDQYNALLAELRLVKVERDLLQERLKAFLRKLFDAKSEARSTEQKDLFLNEAEAIATQPNAKPAQEDEPQNITVASHTRPKRGRKPLDPNLPATLCVMSCLRQSAFVRMTVVV